MSRRLFLDFHDKNRTGKKYQRLFPLPHIWYTCSMKKLCGRCHPHFTQLSIPWINFLLKLNCDRLENSKFALMPVFASQYHGIPLHLWGTLKFSNIFTNKRLYFSQLSKLLGLVFIFLLWHWQINLHPRFIKQSCSLDLKAGRPGEGKTGWKPGMGMRRHIWMNPMFGHWN